MKYSLLSFFCAFGLSGVSMAESTFIPPTARQASANASVNFFEYPDPSNIIETGVIFYYTPDLMDYFGNDITVLTDLIQRSVNFNNLMFTNSGIGISRRVAAVFQTSDDYVDSETYGLDDGGPNIVAEALILTKGAVDLTSQEAAGRVQSFAYELHTPQMEALGASYTTVLQRRYNQPAGSTNSHNWVGLAYRPGILSIITPYDNVEHSPLILAHELGHNDNLRHQRTASDDANQSSNFASNCGRNYSIMHATAVDYEDLFFSDPNHKHSTTGAACGEINRADNSQNLKNRYDSIPVFPSPQNQVKGTVSLLLPQYGSDEFNGIEGEVIWDGLVEGDIASVTVTIADYMDTNPDDFIGAPIVTLIYDGSNSTAFNFQLNLDDGIEVNEKVSLKTMFANGVSDEASAPVETRIISKDYPVISFSESEITVIEGEDITLTVIRQNGSVGELIVFLDLVELPDDKWRFSSEDFDYPSSVTFKDGESSAEIVITATTDEITEGIETDHIIFGGDEHFAGDITMLTINIKDPAKPQFAISNPTLSVNEGSTVSIIINRTEGTEGTLTGNLTLGGGTASSGDYSLSDTTFIIPDGEDYTSITMTVNADIVQDENETLVLIIESTGTTETTVEGDYEVVITIVDVAPPSSFGDVEDSAGGGMSFHILIAGLMLIYTRRRKHN